jgi:hypothetical protein
MEIGYNNYLGANLGVIGTTTATPVILKTNNIERMRIDSAGDLIHNSAMTYSSNKLNAITTDSWAQVAKITFLSTSTYVNGEVKLDCFIGGNSGIGGGYISLAVKYKQQVTTRQFSIKQLENTTASDSYYYYDEATLTYYVYVRVASYSTVRVSTVGEKGPIYDGTIVRVSGDLPVGSVVIDGLSVKKVVNNLVQFLGTGYSFYKTGYTLLDENIGGLESSTLFICEASYSNVC